MSQTVRVERELLFAGAALEEANIGGLPMYKKVFFTDHFIADADESDWIETTYGSTIDHVNAIGGETTIVTGGVDDDCGELSHGLQWSAAKNCVMEARIKTSLITLVGINVGWVDSRHNVNDQINFELNSSNALVNARATDGAVFIFDTDAGTDVWYVAAVDSDTEGTPVATLNSKVPVADTYVNLRVALDSSGNATFYYNGEAVGYLPACLSFAATDLLTPYVAYIARTGAARTLTIDRVTVWQDE